MTKSQKRALENLADVDQFHTPPECRGQTVEVSYGAANETIYKRCTDRSDQSVLVTAYRAPAGWCEGEFEPWNTIPRTGRRIGVVVG